MLGPGVHLKEPEPVGRPVANGLPGVPSPVLHCLSFCGREEREAGHIISRRGSGVCNSRGGGLQGRAKQHAGRAGDAVGDQGAAACLHGSAVPCTAQQSLARLGSPAHVDHSVGLAPGAVGGGGVGVAGHEGDGVAGGTGGAAVADGDRVVVGHRHLQEQAGVAPGE